MTARPSCLALIPARGGSKRIPHKAIVAFHGKPMLAWPLAAAQESGLFDLIHVSTDDAVIRAIAADHGADVSIGRPADLADDFTGLIPVAGWVLRAFEAAGRRFDDVAILYPAAPLLEAQELRAAYSMYLDQGRTRSLLSVARAPTFPEWLYRRAEDGRLTPLQPGGAFIRSQELQPAFFETGAFAIFSREALLDSGRPETDENYIGYEIPAWKAVDIDTPEDLEHARRLFPLLRAG